MTLNAVALSATNLTGWSCCFQWLTAKRNTLGDLGDSEERAARKFAALEFEGNPPGIILRSIDFQTSS